MTGSVARRYAKAIFELARDEGALAPTGAALQVLADIAADPETGAAIANPLLSMEARRAVAKTLADALQLQPTLRNFVALLAEHQRLDQLVRIHWRFERLVDAALGRVRARVSSAAPLDATRQQEVVSTFEGLTGKTVLAEWQVERALLAGIVVDIQGTVYDGSLQTQFDRLARTIAGGRSYL